MTGFISSPFREDNIFWPIREKIRLCLGQMGHQPWAWEVEGKLEKDSQPSKRSEDIISEAIGKSGFLIVVYKTSAGGLFDTTPTLRVYATEFEIIEAIKLGIPILFYVIQSSAREKELKNTISVFGRKIILDDRPKYCKDEKSLIERLRLDVQMLGIRKGNIIHLPFQSNQNSDELNIMHTIISSNLACEEFRLALGIIEKSPQVTSFFPQTKDEKVLFARYLKDCGKIYAHSGKYRKAIQAVRRSIRLLMECGAYNDLFVHIEVLSGIYNMAGYNLAKFVNGYAQRGIKISKELAIRLRDSEASILRDHGEFQKALNRIEEDQDQTPYSGAKFAHLLSLTGQHRCIDRARYMLENNLLPRARMEGRDLEYVLRNAGIVAKIDGHGDQALLFLDEAAEICAQKGALHTKIGIENVRRAIRREG